MVIIGGDNNYVKKKSYLNEIKIKKMTYIFTTI